MWHPTCVLLSLSILYVKIIRQSFIMYLFFYSVIGPKLDLCATPVFVTTPEIMVFIHSLFRFTCIISLCGLRSRSNAEVFTAISDVQDLLDTHKLVIDKLYDYIDSEEKRLLALKKNLNTYKTEHEKAMHDIPNYLGNPINAFTLIKRLTKDLEEIDRKVQSGTEHIRNITTSREGMTYPSTEDLLGAAQALTRLQVTYKLDVKDLAKGVLNGVTYSSPMTAWDCFELGRSMFMSKDYKSTIEWMEEALRRYREEEYDFYSFTEADICDYISWSYYSLGDYKDALKWINDLLDLDPNNRRARSNKEHFEQNLVDSERDSNYQANNMHQQLEHANSDRYEALCRGDYEIPHKISKKLNCFYLTENHPFLRLAPIKAEKRYADPDAYVFYDVISDEEIEHVKRLATPKFQRAMVNDWETGDLIPADYRVSKSSWLDDADSPVVARITKRVADFTGLVMDTAESLQIANYGIGGHYAPHYDFVFKREAAYKQSDNGNRIATVLFYMSEVAQGGATVFTELGLSVFPVKNAALFWMNLHPSGEGDLSTRHAACPVLRGSKWVANKWIHQEGQELIKKAQCNLEYQPEELVRKVPIPILKPNAK